MSEIPWDVQQRIKGAAYSVTESSKYAFLCITHWDWVVQRHNEVNKLRKFLYCSLLKRLVDDYFREPEVELDCKCGGNCGDDCKCKGGE